MAPLPDVGGGVPAANPGSRRRYEAFARVRLSRLDEVRWERFSRTDRTGRSLGRPMTVESSEDLRRPFDRAIELAPLSPMPKGIQQVSSRHHVLAGELSPLRDVEDLRVVSLRITH